MDSNAEPDVLVTTTAFQSPIQSMALRNTEVWVLSEEATQVLVQVDVGTEQAIRTVSLPDDYTWSGVTFVGDDLFVVGRRSSDSTGVIRRVEL